MSVDERTDVRGSPEPSLEATIFQAGSSDVGASAPSSTTALSAGARVSRYLVIRTVGVGGMGAVYAAYDPELDRKVALKLVRFPRGHDREGGRMRLQREAQAMARVSHANVVTVHDVGTHQDQVYVAMEFIEGQTIKAWARTPRQWPEIVEVYRQAGAGLAAAHEQGLVHRDFKPENVMIVARTGRVVVLDFGLARGEVGSTSADSALDPSDPSSARVEPAAPDTSMSTSALLSTELTRAGDVLGTPAYMSPEQFSNGKVDALSDQFAFCVSLYESLYGHRPFVGETPAALVFAITQRQVRPADAARNVPTWLRRAVVRGLAPDPAERWPSMAALLDALSPERRRRTRNILAVAGIVGVAAVGLGLLQRGLTAPNLCTGAGRHLAGVWDGERKSQVDTHVQELGLPWFERTWTAAADRLDAYAAEWITIHQAACEATTRHGEQSERVLDLRMSCLDQAKTKLQAVSDRLRTLDRSQAARVEQLLDGLVPLARCSDLTVLELGAEPPGPTVEAEVAELREHIAGAAAARRLGSTAHAQTLVDLRTRVMAIEYAPLHAEYLHELGATQRFLGHHEPARETLDEALRVALATRQTGLAISALSLLTAVVAVDLQQPAQGIIYASVAKGVMAAPGVEAASVREGQRAFASALGASGRYDEALASYREVLPQIPPDRELERTDTLASIALLLETQGRDQEAEEVYTEVIKTHTALLGEGHPALAVDYSNFGNLMMRQRRFPEAEAAHRRALELDLTLFPPDHPAIAGSRANLGATLAASGQRPAAREQLRMVLDIIGEEHPRAPLIHANLGALALEEDDFAAAEVELRLALTRYATTLGVDHPSTLVVHSTLGAALDGQERYAEAEVEHRIALEIALKAYDADHDLVAKTRQRLGTNLVFQGRPKEALALLEAALEQRLTHDAETPTLAQARYALARALWDGGGDRERARQLASTAAAEFGESKRAAEVRAWLASHR